MNFSPFGNTTGRAASPAGSSRGSSPGRKAVRSQLEDVVPKNDKAYRRYAAAIERTLGTWEIAPEEWADYIAFLSRLLKTLQSHGSEVDLLPHSNIVASKLAQCLNPALPSGVHQKALEVYGYIFSTFGPSHVAKRLHEYLPGLLPLLSYAALSVRPALYDLLEEFVVCIPPTKLRPVLKSLILSLFPPLEDETSEDFDRAISTITKLERAFTLADGDVDLASYFWQSIFLSVISSGSRRQGALNYLNRRLPSFKNQQQKSDAKEEETGLAQDASTAISPEPGLLIRAFACGLADAQPLVQRGFLDLLISNLPLDSPVLQSHVQEKDFQLLISSACGVLLRRDMSLNRRIWQWFLGPQPKDDDGDTAAAQQQQLQFFLKFGLEHLEIFLLSSFSASTSHVSERSKPFRISLSLMDRWEIGGQLLPRIFLPAMISAFRFSQTASSTENTELLKSASLFFDGVESRLIWCKLFELASTTDAKLIRNNFALLQWILNIFNIQEEDMMNLYAPLTALYLLDTFATADSTIDEVREQILSIVTSLLQNASTRSLTSIEKQQGPVSGSAHSEDSSIHDKITSFFKADASAALTSPFTTTVLSVKFAECALHSLRKASPTQYMHFFPGVVGVMVLLFRKVSSAEDLPIERTLDHIDGFMKENKSELDFECIQALVSLLASIASFSSAEKMEIREQFIALEAQLTPFIWHYISPFNTTHNIEAVRLLWRVDAILEHEDVVQASIQSLLVEAKHKSSNLALKTFLNLWTLSQTQPSSQAKTPVVGVRRASGSILSLESDKNVRRLHLLSKPLMNILSMLSDTSTPQYYDVCSWINVTSNAESVLNILGGRLELALSNIQSSSKGGPSKQMERGRQEALRSIRMDLLQLDHILSVAQSGLWQAVEVKLQVSEASGKQITSIWLLDVCSRLLPGVDDLPADVSRSAVTLLVRLLSNPTISSHGVISQEFLSLLIDKLESCIKSSNLHLQSCLLQLISKSVDLIVAGAQDETMSRHASLPRPSVSGTLANHGETTHSTSILPISKLVKVLRQGFSTPQCYSHLDSWLQFLESICGNLGEAITTVLIPIIETICAQLQHIFEHLQLLSQGNTVKHLFSPDVTAVRLIHALSITMGKAHQALLFDETSSESAQENTSSTVLTSVTPSLFRAQAPQNKTAKANNRLTVIIASKDVVSICVRIWHWASEVGEGQESDRRNALTMTHTAMKLRNNAKNMLEEVFNHEPLESLEVVISIWAEAESQSEKDSIINLLHVLPGRKPKNTIPAILDSLCSRTNPSMLTPSRQSSLTSEISSASAALFYSAYIESLEDDALDEIWSDCTSFFKDVLSNPLPFRQVLPALIWIVSQLARKLDNTNYGEQKRMRRELGDFFQRLLAATFAATPSGFTDYSKDAYDQETTISAGLESLNLVVLLREIVSRAEYILETSDRIASLITSVSTNIITPVLRNKTFPARVNADILALILRVAKKSPMSKIWRNDISNAMNDPRFTLCSSKVVEACWFPIIQQWCVVDKERTSEILSRLSAPSSAGIMFGVGANAARLDADRKTQLNLRRLCLLLLACPNDTHTEHLRLMEEKMVELFEASNTSSPSLAVKAELFMILRALLLSISQVHFAAFWPMVNDQLQAALLNLQYPEKVAQNNLSLLQACKLLDVLAVVSPDDFQLHEWIYITNTTDAVYHPPDWSPTALSDQLANNLDSPQNDDNTSPQHDRPNTPKSDGLIKPLLDGGAGFDTQDIKAMAHDHFVNAALKPFLSQLSISIYENRYRMDKPDLAAYRRGLLDDIQDAATIVS